MMMRIIDQTKLSSSLQVCGVCTKAFTDNAAYREHEAAGCIDYD